MKTIHSKHAPAAIGPYSQAVRVGGFVFLSGQIEMCIRDRIYSLTVLPLGFNFQELSVCPCQISKLCHSFFLCRPLTIKTAFRFPYSQVPKVYSDLHNRRYFLLIQDSFLFADILLEAFIFYYTRLSARYKN